MANSEKTPTEPKGPFVHGRKLSLPRSSPTFLIATRQLLGKLRPCYALLCAQNILGKTSQGFEAAECESTPSLCLAYRLQGGAMCSRQMPDAPMSVERKCLTTAHALGGVARGKETERKHATHVSWHHPQEQRASTSPATALLPHTESHRRQCHPSRQVRHGSMALRHSRAEVIAPSVLGTAHGLHKPGSLFRHVAWPHAQGREFDLRASHKYPEKPQQYVPQLHNQTLGL